MQYVLQNSHEQFQYLVEMAAVIQLRADSFKVWPSFAWNILSSFVMQWEESEQTTSLILSSAIRKVTLLDSPVTNSFNIYGSYLAVKQSAGSYGFVPCQNHLYGYLLCTVSFRTQNGRSAPRTFGHENPEICRF